MNDEKILFAYRLKQAEETLADAEAMLRSGLSPRSITNRAYYSMFYAILALFLKSDIRLKTSKHGGLVSIFDKEFVLTGKIDKRYSRILHDVFDARQEGDYKEFADVSPMEGAEHVTSARKFLDCIKELCC